MAARKTFYFAVVGRYTFPYDMLRYDRCYPYSEQTDSPGLSVGPGFDFDYWSRPRVVVLVAQWEAGYRNTPGRWESFGWRVSGVYDAPHKAREAGDEILNVRF